MLNILCYGDSNTFGLIPVVNKRYSINERWTGILQYILGNDYRIIEEGLNGRTTVFDDPFESGRNGIAYIEIALATHKPLDLIILALGTNDVKVHFSATSNLITKGIKRIIFKIRNSEDSMGYKKPEILLLAPPPIGDKVDIVNDLSGFNQNSVKISKELPEKYKLLAEQEKVYFFDLGSIVQSSEKDQIHLDKESHKIIAENLAREIKNIFNK
ncbi:SGNH/GDSL hydrolase family protein [Brachyspira sp. SAP_772]|uniref:SGNH/GDSL hydrolase family protein n=1 Tax=Brachyspira sp. SAP_772 TaxID=2608385 RepID=UPI0012F4A46F|nr:SGNH/GDSL hydrolase family protein [Brachyspira sp. SAP_772]